MNEQLIITIITKLTGLRLNLMVHPDNEPNSEFEDRISDLDYIIQKLQSLQPKEQVNQDSVKLPLSGESKLSAEEGNRLIVAAQQYALNNCKSDMSALTKVKLAFEAGAKAMHDFANNSEAMKWIVVEEMLAKYWYENEYSKIDLISQKLLAEESRTNFNKWCELNLPNQ